VAPVAHHLRGQVDRVADVFQARDPAGAQGRALHDSCIELDFPVCVQAGADAGVEQGLVLHMANRRHCGNQGTIADLGPAELEGTFNSGLALGALG
jgi:hypothetical protein